MILLFFFSSRRRHTRFKCDWSSDVCSSDLGWQRHRRRLQGSALFRRRRGALLVRRYISDPESDPRQSHHRAECLHLSALFISPPTYTREAMMDAPVTENQPAATLRPANVLY